MAKDEVIGIVTKVIENNKDEIKKILKELDMEQPKRNKKLDIAQEIIKIIGDDKEEAKKIIKILLASYGINPLCFDYHNTIFKD